LTFNAGNAAPFGKRIASGSLKAAAHILRTCLGVANLTAVTLDIARSTVSGYDFRGRIRFRTSDASSSGHKADQLAAELQAQNIQVLTISEYVRRDFGNSMPL
jgi:hypothetical protein